MRWKREKNVKNEEGARPLKGWRMDFDSVGRILSAGLLVILLDK